MAKIILNHPPEVPLPASISMVTAESMGLKRGTINANAYRYFRLVPFPTLPKAKQTESSYPLSIYLMEINGPLILLFQHTIQRESLTIEI